MEKHNSPSSAETLEEKRQQALQQCDRLINDFAQRADRHKARYKRLQTVSIALAAGTTVLSALSASKLIAQLDWIVLAVSGFSTLLTTLLGQTNSQKMWVQSRNISQAFQMETFLYLQCAGEYANLQDDSVRLQLFSKRLMEIWSQAQERWSQQTTSGT